MYFRYLRDNNYDLVFRKADDATLSLVKYGEFLYENVIIFAPSVREFGGKLNVKAITSFVDGGGSVLVTGSPAIGEAIRELASECGLEFDEEHSAVIDHHQFDARDAGSHTLLVAAPRQLLPAPVVVGAARTGAPLLYRGIGMTAAPDNALVLPVLVAAGTAYASRPDSSVDAASDALGRTSLLLAGVQARNNARMLFVGSLEFFSDELFVAPVAQAVVGDGVAALTAARSGNQALCEALSGWLFKERGVLRVGQVLHRRVGEAAAPAYYTILERVEYRVQIEMLERGLWVPYNGQDVQLEFQRIDPFVRLNMKRDNASSAFYVAEFKLPDVYGVYQYIINYQRLGWTTVYSSTQVSVRPLKHTQYERFILAAYPYYASAFSMMLGVLIFSFAFLHHRDDLKSKDE